MDPRELGCRCDECPLRGQTPVFPTRAKDDNPRLVIVGEGPGKTEERLGRPFVGKSGALLDQSLRQSGIRREECHITNAVLCRGERDIDNEKAASCCAPRLFREISGYGVAILTLGKIPTSVILGSKSILLSRGFIWRARDLSDAIAAAKKSLKRLSKGKHEQAKLKAQADLEELELRNRLAGRVVFPTIHPAFVLRSEAWRALFDLDIARVALYLRNGLWVEDDIKRVSSVEEFTREEGVWTFGDDPSYISACAGALGQTVACDIETDSVNPLSANCICVGLSDGLRTIIIDPWQPGIHAPLLTDLLRGRTVVFHNGYGFDHIVLQRDGVVFSEPPEDTLLAHHAFASHFPQKLDQVVSTFTNFSPWKIRFGRRGQEEKGGLAPADMAPEERDFYCACDCVGTALSWTRMQGDLEPERGVYEADKKVAEVCKNMQIVGIGVDLPRRDRLLDELRERADALEGELRSILNWKSFSPSKPAHVREALYDRLKAPVLACTESGLPSTAEIVLESFASQDTPLGHFAKALMDWRVVTKVRSTYVEPIPILADGRAHYNWKSFGTVSGRLAGRLQSCPRWGSLPEQKPRELYVPGGLPGVLVAQIHDAAIFEVGDKFVYFDLSQAEARFAAYLSGDPKLIEAVQSDFHTANAKLAFKELPGAVERLNRANEKGPDGQKWKNIERKYGGCKEERDVAKNCGFCILYGGTADKLFTTLRSKGFEVSMRACTAMVNRFSDTYHVYDKWAARNLERCRQVGYLRSAILGRRRHLGYFPSATDVRNYPIQSGIADVMNIRLVGLVEKVRGQTDPEKVKQAILDTWQEPVVIPKSDLCPSGAEFLLPAEVKIGSRWSDF